MIQCPDASTNPAPANACIVRADGNEYYPPHSSQLVFVASGPLAGIPFGSLPINDSGACLSEVYTAGTFCCPNLLLFKVARERVCGSLRLSMEDIFAVQNLTRDLPLPMKK